MRTFSCAHDRFSTSHSSYEKNEAPPQPEQRRTHSALVFTPPSSQDTPSQHDMASTKDTSTYSASVNPPRKAKRARTETEITTSTSSSAQAAPAQARHRPHILPRDTYGNPSNESPMDHESSEDEDEYDPVEPAPAPKRRGRKPGPLSRSARESQRKLNHSRIEKARRTKINETLATLSNLVSDAEKQRAAASGTAVVEVEEKGKGEKEFKLDVLVKTVTYIQELIHRVKTLEVKSCSRCTGTSQTAPVSPPESPSISRKRKADDLDVGVDVLEVADDADDERDDESSRHTMQRRAISVTSPPSRAMSKAPSQSPCLPPISSWLPNPYVDPSCLASMSDPSVQPSHLPTPPLSGSFRVPMSVSSQAPPALVLPGPAHPMPADTEQSFSTNKAMRISMPSRRLSNAATVSPSVSPSWTPEDETAASLLLQMSSSPNTSSLRLRGNSFGSMGGKEIASMQAQTPSSLLGLGRHD